MMPGTTAAWEDACRRASQSARLWFVLIALVLGIQVRWWWDPGPDTSSYLSAARHFVRGEAQSFGMPHLMHPPGYSLLICPLVWIHVLIQDVLVGVHAIDLDYVAMRWATLGWRIYDIALLAFAFAHGMNGLRNVLSDYVHPPGARRLVNVLLLAGWLVISAIGAAAIVGGVQTP